MVAISTSYIDSSHSMSACVKRIKPLGLADTSFDIKIRLQFQMTKNTSATAAILTAAIITTPPESVASLLSDCNDRILQGNIFPTYCCKRQRNYRFSEYDRGT